VSKKVYSPESPREIYFTRVQTLWVLKNLPELSAGDWPVDSEETECKAFSRTAPFITAVECSAEVRVRLQKCGIDGLILLATECWGESDEALSMYLNIPIWSIRKRYKLALRYVASGPDRRWHKTKRHKGETYEQYNDRMKKGHK